MNDLQVIAPPTPPREGTSTPPVPRWLRVWAVLTALAALPLVTLGAEVTTKKVGMVDPKGFRAPWHLFTVALQERGLGYVIEHGHRLAGFVVGICCIVLAVGLTMQARGAFYRSLGWLALVAVSLQGVLGIFRVDLNALFGSSLALIHGCFAQLAFATLVAVAVMTSMAWSCSPPEAHAEDARKARFLARASGLLCVLVYLQIVFGAIVRHKLNPVAQRLHVLLAFVVVVGVFWMVGRLRQDSADRPALRLGYFLAGLMVLQPVFGVEAWIQRFGRGVLPELIPSSVGLDLVRSGHQVLGTLIFATTVSLAVMLYRPAVRAAGACAPRPAALEDAA